MIQTIFFDRDGIINDVIIRGQSISSPRDLNEFRLRQDFCNLYSHLNGKQLKLFVVSNQPDITRGLLDEAELHKMTGILEQRFAFAGIAYCYHDDNDNCGCRKPKPGMIIQLLQQNALTAERAVIIGDSARDILAGQAAGITTVLYRQPYNASTNCHPDFVVDKLADILRLPGFPSSH